MSFKKQVNACVSTLLAVWVLILSSAVYSPALHTWVKGQDTESRELNCPCHKHTGDDDEGHSTNEVSFCAVSFFMVGFHSVVADLAPKLAIGEFWIPGLQECRLAGFAAAAQKQARAPPAV